jgi:phage baseplate assembly protein W
MAYMSRITGKEITDKEDLTQSINDILTTPLGSRVSVRDYGCDLSELIDKPVNRAWITDAFSGIASSLAYWEPRYALTLIQIDASSLSAGIIGLALTGIYKPTGRVMVLENISLNFGV